MADVARITVLGCALLACSSCSGPADVATNVADPVMRISVTRIPGAAAYVHVLAANPSSQEFSWEIAAARISMPAEGSNCEGAVRAYADREMRDEPQFILQSLATLRPGSWQARTLPVPESLLGVGCVLDVSIISFSEGREFAKRHIEVLLIEGFFETAPRAISMSPPRVAAEFVGDHEWYLIRVLAQARTQTSMTVEWPTKAICSNGAATVALDAVPLTLLPEQQNQRVAAGQWATASVAVRTRDGGAPPLESCTAEIAISLVDANADESIAHLKMELSRQPSTVSSTLIWSGCPDCQRPHDH